ncbi:MAG: preprotein translocase subunit SecA [Ruminococcaceae bacterium]|nr:preprotein translocase subunit SecA [Oscillospiraceae bacterium]
MGKIIDKIFGTYSERQIKKLMPIVEKIEAMAPEYKAMSDDELRSMTDKLKGRLAGVETLDDILPDAFATVREAADRVLGKRPFKVQVLGGIILHQGRIAEMKTGEGKTLVATLPAYLNALSGNGVHIVTVNEYLAKCGSEEMGKVFGFLGLTTGLVIHDQSQEAKQRAYEADITYGTNNEMGFDFLRDNMTTYKNQLVQRGHAFAIVDEVDSILIDEARTPLIISGAGQKSTDLYDQADRFVRTLTKFVIKELDDKELNEEIEADYIVDEKAKNVTLTPQGIIKAEQYFQVENLSDQSNSTLSHHINQAIKAHGSMQRDVNYIVKNGEVLIVDEFTGRVMPGRRYSDGLHQAIEAKERVDIQKETKTLATITFQNYFRQYKKLSGMTGTALTEENEFREIYNLDVVEVPTNMPMIRKDHSDVVYKTVAGKYRAIVKQIKDCHEKGQPVLVGTVSIEKSEELSKMLKKAGIPHTVLNAKYHEKEAEIVAQAGKLGAVTISTNMAGRGTDIMLGGNPDFLAKMDLRKEGYDESVIILAAGMSNRVSEEVLEAREKYHVALEKHREEIAPEADKVREAGGLFIVGTERHESRRIDNQLRGRSGRQGDPGESRFFLSLEDDLMRLFGSERVMGTIEKLGLDEDQPIDAAILSGAIEGAQKRLEEANFQRRKHVLNYDDVMNQQRLVIYKQRRDVLDGLDLKDTVKGMIDATIDEVIDRYTASEVPDEWNFDGLRTYFFGLLCKPDDFKYTTDDLNNITREDIKGLLHERADKLYASKEEAFGEGMREVERTLLLRAVDTNWMNHIDAMDELRSSIALQAYAQRNPINEYRLTGADMFDDMIAQIREDTMRLMLSVVPKPNTEIKREQVAKPLTEGFADGKQASTGKSAPVRAERKVGRNDPCPCGSGKKYKKCCGRGDDADSAEE